MRRSKFHIRVIDLWKWFPANDIIATEMARLCILKEDFIYDLFGVTEESIPTLDKFEKNYRKIYFFRNMIKTLNEIRNVTETLSYKKEFKGLLRIEPAIETAFNDLKKELSKASKLFKDIRNEIACHIKSGAMSNALVNLGMEQNRSGIIQLGKTAIDTRFKFASELLMGILFKDIPYEEHQDKANDILNKITDITKALNAIDVLIIHYAISRGLLSK